MHIENKSRVLKHLWSASQHYSDERLIIFFGKDVPSDNRMKTIKMEAVRENWGVATGNSDLTRVNCELNNFIKIPRLFHHYSTLTECNRDPIPNLNRTEVCSIFSEIQRFEWVFSLQNQSAKSPFPNWRRVEWNKQINEIHQFANQIFVFKKKNGRSITVPLAIFQQYSWQQGLATIYLRSFHGYPDENEMETGLPIQLAKTTEKSKSRNRIEKHENRMIIINHDRLVVEVHKHSFPTGLSNSNYKVIRKNYDAIATPLQRCRYDGLSTNLPSRKSHNRIVAKKTVRKQWENQMIALRNIFQGFSLVQPKLTKKYFKMMQWWLDHNAGTYSSCPFFVSFIIFLKFSRIHVNTFECWINNIIFFCTWFEQNGEKFQSKNCFCAKMAAFTNKYLCFLLSVSHFCLCQQVWTECSRLLWIASAVQ